ncbi:MAG: LacI family transcriptional regulator [Ruminococcaceae bacterium]|nr:LacI family transcriptional regulator [Oscillospiraceae bacterium]
MVTIDDIIKLSGVSRSTVNRFLAGQQVRADNAKKIKMAMKELGYRPDKLVEKRKCTIEIIGGDGCGKPAEFQGFAQMLIHMIKALEEGGATVQMQSGSSQYAPKADGVILYGLSAETEDKYIEILKKRKIPFVFAYRAIDRPGISYVTCDNYLAAYEMTEMLIKDGHRNIAVCGASSENRNMEEKYRGFVDCMKAHNITIRSSLVLKENQPEIVEEWIRKLFETKEEFSAFFALRDRLALDFHQIAREYGYRVPEDFSTVGMDGSIEVVYSSPKLSGVAIPFEHIGKKAAETIFRLIDNPDTASIREVLKYEMVLRESYRHN